MSKNLQTRTEQNQQLMLEKLTKTPIIQACCEHLNISRSTFYRWKSESKEFAKKADVALAEGVALMNDLAEHQLLMAIKNGNTSSIFYWLNHRHSAYSNKLEITAKVKDETLSPEQQELISKALRHATLLPPEVKGGGDEVQN